MQPDKKHKRAELWASLGILLATVIWGWGFVFVRFSLDAGLSPAAVMLGRFTISTVLLSILFFRTLRRQLRAAHWKRGIIIGLLMFVSMMTQTTGMQSTTPGNGAFITASYVVMVPIVWWVVTRQKSPPITIFSCVLAMAGVVILSVDFSGGFSVSIGDAIILFSAVLFACHIVAITKLGHGIHHISLAFMQFVTAAVCAFVVFMITDRDVSGYATWEGGVSMLYLGILSTCLCFTLQTAAQKHLSSAKAGILLSTEALFGAVSSVIAGYDILSVRMVVGGLIMFSAIILPDVWQQLRDRARVRQQAGRVPSISEEGADTPSLPEEPSGPAS